MQEMDGFCVEVATTRRLPFLYLSRLETKGHVAYVMMPIPSIVHASNSACALIPCLHTVLTAQDRQWHRNTKTVRDDV